MSHVRTSVITVNYNGAEDTTKCLQSLTKSVTPIFAFVVDNTPKDSELFKLEEILTNVKFFWPEKNLGFGNGNNLAIDWVLENTSAEFVYILNNDAQVFPDTISLMERAMDERPEAAIVASRVVLSEADNVLWYGGGRIDWRRGGGYVPGILGPANNNLAMKSRYVTFASGCSMMIRADVLRKTGGFDPRFFMYEEDVELCLRVQRDGWKIWYLADALVTHKGQGSLRKAQGGKFMGAWDPKNPNLSFYAFHILRNRLLNMWTYASGKHRLEFLLYFPLFILAKVVRFVLECRWDGLRALYMGWHSARREVKG